MGVATGSTVVSTQFDLPTTIDTGASTLQVVANGIPSATVAVTVFPPPAHATGTIVVSGTPSDSGTAQITMNGRAETIVYDTTGVNGPGTTQDIAIAFASAFNNDPGSFVTATAVQDAHPPYDWDINFVTKGTGNVNYVFSTSCSYCAPPSFTLTPTVGQLTGGH
jgi:phage tail sheath gpL-like